MRKLEMGENKWNYAFFVALILEIMLGSLFVVAAVDDYGEFLGLVKKKSCDNALERVALITANMTYEQSKENCVSYFCKNDFGCDDVAQARLLCDQILLNWEGADE